MRRRLRRVRPGEEIQAGLHAASRQGPDQLEIGGLTQTRLLNMRLNSSGAL